MLLTGVLTAHKTYSMLPRHRPLKPQGQAVDVIGQALDPGHFPFIIGIDHWGCVEIAITDVAKDHYLDLMLVS